MNRGRNHRVIAADDLPGIDLEAAIERVGGHRRALLDILKSFHRRFRGSEAEIEELWNRGERQQARERSHLIKGVAGNVSANDLYTCSARLEEAIRTDEDAAVPALVAEHRRALEEVLIACGSLEAPAGDQPSPAVGAPLQEADLEGLRPQLEELARLLSTNDFKARTVFRRVRDSLTGTAVAGELDVIANDIDGLDFTAARQKLLQFAKRQGLDLRRDSGAAPGVVID